MLVRIATVLADRDPEAAAVLDGAGHGLAPEFVHHPITAADLERAVTTTVAALGAARRAELYERGLALSDDEAVVYATEAVARYLSEQ